MKIFLTVWITAVLTGSELITGNMGLALGLPVFGALYFAVAFFPEYGIAAAGISGILLDAAYGRTLPSASVLYIITVALASYMVTRGQREHLLSPLLSGALCGLLIFTGNLLTSVISQDTFPGPDIFSTAVFQIAGGGIFMLLLVLLFDAVNLRCDLPCFIPGKKKNNLPGESGI